MKMISVENMPMQERHWAKRRAAVAVAAHKFVACNNNATNK